MAIPRKNSDIPRVVGDFRYLNKRLAKLNMTFPLVRECIQAIGASQCEVMSVIDLRDAYHTLQVSPIISTIHRHYTILWCRHLPISSNGYGFEYSTSYMANIYKQYFETDSQQKQTYCNNGRLLSTFQVCRSFARSHKPVSIID